MQFLHKQMQTILAENVKKIQNIMQKDNFFLKVFVWSNIHFSI